MSELPGVDKQLIDWGEPVLAAVEKRSKGRRYLKALAIVLIVASGSASYVYAPLLVGTPVPYLGFFITWLAFGFVSLFVYFIADLIVTFVAPVPQITIPQIYSLSLLRILQSAETSPHQLEDATAGLVKRINFDLSELEDNLSASKTVRVLRELRTLLLKFVTAALENDPAKHEVLYRMKQSLGTGASWFYKFEDIESLHPILETDLQTGRIAAITERASIASPIRPWINVLRSWTRLPFSLHMLTLFLVAGFSGWLLYTAIGPFGAILVTVALAIVLSFRADISEWSKRRFGE